MLNNFHVNPFCVNKKLKKKYMRHASDLGFNFDKPKKKDEDQSHLYPVFKKIEKTKEKEKYDPAYVLKGLKIYNLPSKSTDLKTNELMKEGIIPKHPFCVLNVGRSGSGKSMLLTNMFLNEDMLLNFFDEIYLYSRTGKCDDLFSYQDVDEDNIIVKDEVEHLKKLISQMQEEADEHGTSSIKTRCIIFEDVTANTDLMGSQDFLRAFVQLRHYNCSVFACCHKFKGITGRFGRTARVNVTNYVYLPR